MFQKNETYKALKECYLMSNIPKRNLACGRQPSLRTTRRNYKHIPEIVSISSRFRVLHLLSWEVERSEVLWRDTVILVCHFKTCWSRLIYTKLSSHWSFVISMYVLTKAWRCISPWSFRRSLQRRREMDVFHICQQIFAHSQVKQ